MCIYPPSYTKHIWICNFTYTYIYVSNISLLYLHIRNTYKDKPFNIYIDLFNYRPTFLASQLLSTRRKLNVHWNQLWNVSVRIDVLSARIMCRKLSEHSHKSKINLHKRNLHENLHIYIYISYIYMKMKHETHNEQWKWMNNENEHETHILHTPCKHKN